MAMKWTEPLGPPPRRATPSLDQVSWGSGLPSATQFRSRASPTSAFRSRGPGCTWGGTDRATGRAVKAGAPGGGSHRAQTYREGPACCRAPHTPGRRQPAEIVIVGGD